MWKKEVVFGRINFVEQDIRWKQRFQNYCNVLENFSEAIELLSKRNLSKLEKQGRSFPDNRIERCNKKRLFCRAYKKRRHLDGYDCQ